MISSRRPYLIRAIYDWIVDNDLTPHVVLDAEREGVDVPHQYVEDGKIVLKIAPSAIRDLLIDGDGISFSARFGGKPMTIYSPIGAVITIYASENGQGLSFESRAEPDAASDNSDDDPDPPKAPPKGKRPALRVVK